MKAKRVGSMGVRIGLSNLCQTKCGLQDYCVLIDRP